MNSPAERRPLRLGAVLPALLSLAGCVTAPAFDEPSIGEAAAAVLYREAVVAAQPALSDAQPPAKWWEVFNDPTLLALESEVAANLDLQAAAVRIEESRAQLGLADASLRPGLSADGGYSRGAISENSPTHRLGAPTAGYDTWSLGLQAAWEIDFWGYLRHLSDSARAKLLAARYGKQAAEVSTTAEVARTYLLLRGVQAQTSLVESSLQLAQDLVRMAESRERNGVASRFDAASARADASGLEARLTQLHRERDALMNALAFLLGKPPRELNGRLAATALPPMPSRLPIGVPSELARRRPDILQAEAKLRAAVADIGAAQADFYPRISLTGALGVQAFNLSDLGSWASRQYAVGPTLHLPIFEGGRLRSQLALTEARKRLAGLAYQQTVLRAWHEVDDALGAYASELKRHEQLESAQQNNEIALAVAQRSYQEGSTDFTTVLVARRTLLATQAELSNSATASALAVVALYRALGGSWVSEQQPGAEQSAAAS